jgi:hypothetical protein
MHCKRNVELDTALMKMYSSRFLKVIPLPEFLKNGSSEKFETSRRPVTGSLSGFISEGKEGTTNDYIFPHLLPDKPKLTYPDPDLNVFDLLHHYQ